MTRAPREARGRDRRNRRDCDDAVEEVTQRAALEIEKAWTDQQSDTEALVNIDGILGEATDHDAVERTRLEKPAGRLPFDGPAEGKR